MGRLDIHDQPVAALHEDVPHVPRSLPNSPVAVGFDVDNTLIFPSGGFNCVLNNQDGPNGTHHDGGARQSEQIGCDLRALHTKRGDRIDFITARVGVNGEALDQRLQKWFGVKPAEPVFFTGFKSKTGGIPSRGIAAYYGDADTNIEYAQAAAARGARVMRALNPVDCDKAPRNGHFGVEILIDSDR